jgi:hypothetical protein
VTVNVEETAGCSKAGTNTIKTMTMTMIIANNLLATHSSKLRPTLRLCYQASFAVIVPHKLCKAPDFATAVAKLSRWLPSVPVVVQGYPAMRPSARNAGTETDKSFLPRKMPCQNKHHTASTLVRWKARF